VCVKTRPTKQQHTSCSSQWKVNLTAPFTSPPLPPSASSVLTVFTKTMYLHANTDNSLAQAAAPEALTPVKVQDWN